MPDQAAVEVPAVPVRSGRFRLRGKVGTPIAANSLFRRMPIDERLQVGLALVSAGRTPGPPRSSRRACCAASGGQVAQ